MFLCKFDILFGNVKKIFSESLYNLSGVSSCLVILDGTYILKAKSNFTLFSTEYIYTRSDFKQMEFCD